ncbi:30S ribosomal protein S5 [Listeria monocytogenes]|nr:30S ribosomal protein S5 [Listeria monocytogenes]
MKRKRRPPLTTLATRLIVTTRSSKSNLFPSICSGM